MSIWEDLFKSSEERKREAKETIRLQKRALQRIVDKSEEQIKDQERIRDGYRSKVKEQLARTGGSKNDPIVRNYAQMALQCDDRVGRLVKRDEVFRRFIDACDYIEQARNFADVAKPLEASLGGDISEITKVFEDPRLFDQQRDISEVIDEAFSFGSASASGSNASVDSFLDDVAFELGYETGAPLNDPSSNRDDVGLSK